MNTVLEKRLYRFLIILILLSIYAAESEEKLIDIKKLDNINKYFVALHSGLYLYDENFTNCALIIKFNNSVYREDNNKINITSLTNDNNIYIFSLINEYLFLFNSTNNMTFSYKINDIDIYNSKYCNLMPYKYSNNKILSFILVINNEKNELNFYWYNFTTNYDLYQPKLITFNNMNIENNMIRCLLYYDFSGIKCYHYEKNNDTHSLIRTFFTLSSSMNINYFTYNNISVSSFISEIKAAVSYNNKYFICILVGEERILHCYINYNEKFDNAECGYWRNCNVRFKLFYFNETKDFFYISAYEKGSYSINIIDNYKNCTWRNYNKSNIFDFIILYNKYEDNYTLYDINSFENYGQCKEIEILLEEEEDNTIFFDIKKISDINKYFVVLNRGIYLYNEHLLECSSIFYFKSDVIRNDNNKITIKELKQESNIYVLSLINEYLFIFNTFNNRTYLHEINLINISKDDYYTLLPYKIINKKISFYLAMVCNDSYLLFYYYDFYPQEKTDNQKIINSYNINIKNNVISCLINSDENLIYCFYSSQRDNQNCLASSYFFIDNDNFTKSETYILNSYSEQPINIIKVVSSLNNKNLICVLYGENNILTCYINNYLTNTLKEIGCNFGFRINPRFKIYFFEETLDFLIIGGTRPLLTLIKSTKDSAEFCALNKIGNEVQKENFEVIYNNTSSNYQLIKYNNFFNSTAHCIDLIISEKDDAFNCTEEKKYEFKNICYDSCPNGTVYSKEKKYFCEPECDDIYPFEILETQECVEFCSVYEIKNNLCALIFISDDEGDKENEDFISDKNIEMKEETSEEKQKKQDIKSQDKMLQTVDKAFTSEKYDTSELDKGNDEVIQEKKMTITLTTTDNQKNNSNKNNINMTTINLYSCEDRLREVYNISKENKLYMKKVEVIIKGMKIPKIEFDIYSKLNGSNLVKLNLTYCKDTKVEMSIPVDINPYENLDEYDSSSGYYNDICYTTTSESGTDITIDDRQKNFIKNNKTLCQDGCDFIKYNFETKKSECACNVKSSSKTTALMNININELYNKFIDVKNIINISILKCYRVLLSNKGIKRNIGFYIIILVIIIHIISVFIFYRKQIYILKNKIKDIIFGLNHFYLIEDKKIILKKKIKKRGKSRSKSIRISKNEEDKKGSEDNKINNNNDAIHIKNIDKESHNPPKRKGKKIYKIIKRNNTINLKNNSNINNNKITTYITKEDDKDKKKELISKTIVILSLTPQELNNLSYNDALKFDDRSFCNYYILLLKIKHIILFTFFYNGDYNAKIIKIDLFFMGVIIYSTINAMFFNDNTMHNIYKDEGKFNFIYQLPQIVYSSIISVFFNTLLKVLSLSEGDIINLKSEKEKFKNKLSNKIKKNILSKKESALNHKLQIKFNLFFIISTVFLIFFWFYLSMFCAIYKNTQIYLIKDTLISFGLSLVYPFCIYLFPGFFRIYSLKDKKGNRNYFFLISRLLQYI